MDQEDRLEVAVIGKTVYIKPAGYATQENSLGLPDFITAMFRQGCSDVTFDLKDCPGIDSTFLGVIATAAISQEPGGRKTVVVLNAEERVRRELRVVGLMSVVAVKQEPVELPGGLRLKQIDFIHFPGTERERIKMVKRLHEELIKLNRKNRELFSGFVDMLDSELQEKESADG